MIIVTAATGKLGQHVVDALLEKLPASKVAVAVRNVDKAEALAARGVSVRHADYNAPETLVSAFAGAEKLLLISSNEIGQRESQHRAAISAAKKAGVGFIAYTSILHADTAKLGLAREHLATERALADANIPHALLRNGWYLENYTENLAAALAHGVLLGSAKDGRVAAASRRDFAEAAATILVGDAGKTATYELAGDDALTMNELASVVSEVARKPVRYQDLPVEAYRDALVGFGVPAPFAELLADSDDGIARGELDEPSKTLSTLIGRPTTKLRVAVERALAGK